LCVCVRMRASAWVGAGVCLRACSLTNPACNTPPYCHLLPLAPPHFSTSSHKRPLSGKKLLNNFFFIFPTTFIWNISHSKNSAGYCHKFENVFKWKTRYSFPILTKLESSQHTFVTSSNIKFHQNPSIGRRVVPYIHTYRQADMKLIVVFHNFVNGPKKWQIGAFKLNGALFQSSVTFKLDLQAQQWRTKPWLSAI
jgi:hypothetical protein